MIKLTEGHYVLKDDNIEIFMTIDFQKRTFDLQTKCGKCDFTFLGSKPEYANKVICLMASGATTAQQLLDQYGSEYTVVPVNRGA